VNISPEFLYEISSQLLNWNVIADAFGLTQEERRSPSAGKWIMDRVRQYQTAALLSGGLRDKLNKGIEKYEPEIINPLKEKSLHSPDEPTI
jgi:hypothetical protein